MLTINTNVQSLFTQRQLNQNASALTKVMERLSSGVRINSAKDDAAGLQISDRMSSQIRGLNQASRNLNDGISLMQTAEGAMQEVTNMLQRMRELSVQAANDGALSDSDKKSLQAEVSQLLQEVNRIAENTEFNGKYLLNAGRGNSLVGDADKLEVLDGLKTFWLKSAEDIISNEFGIVGSGQDLTVILDDASSADSDGAGGTAAFVRYTTGGSGGTGTSMELHIDMPDFLPVEDENGGSYPFYNDRIIAHELTHAVMASTMNVSTGIGQWFMEGTAEFIHGGDERVRSDTVTIGDSFSWDQESNDYSDAYVAVRYMHEQIKAAGGNGIKDIMAYLSSNAGSSLNDAITNASNGAWGDEAAFKADYTANGAAFLGTLNLDNPDTGAVGGSDADGGDVKTAESTIPNQGGSSEDPLTGFNVIWPEIGGGTAIGRTFIQAGADEGQTIALGAIAADSTSMNIDDIDVSENANLAIVKLDRALDYINGERGKLGAAMNRLEHAAAVTLNTAENLTASRSRILDADISQEAAEMTKRSILMQSTTSLLVQANQSPQMALQLLS